MMRTCSRAFSIDSNAQGSEPSAPPSATAITRSASMTPAIGASTIGNSVLKRSRILRSGHMVCSCKRGSWRLARLRARTGEREAGGRQSSPEGRGRVAPSLQYLVCLVGDALDDFGRRRNIMDQPDRFTGVHSGDIEITGVPCREIFGRNRLHLLHQFNFVPDPATGMVVDQAAPGKG